MLLVCPWFFFGGEGISWKTAVFSLGENLSIDTFWGATPGAKPCVIKIWWCVMCLSGWFISCCYSQRTRNGRVPRLQTSSKNAPNIFLKRQFQENKQRIQEWKYTRVFQTFENPPKKCVEIDDFRNATLYFFHAGRNFWDTPLYLAAGSKEAPTKIFQAI